MFHSRLKHIFRQIRSTTDTWHSIGLSSWIFLLLLLKVFVFSSLLILPCDALHASVVYTAAILSVRLFVTHVPCIETAEQIDLLLKRRLYTRSAHNASATCMASVRSKIRLTLPEIAVSGQPITTVATWWYWASDFVYSTWLHGRRKHKNWVHVSIRAGGR